jgi:DNA-binding CsgD family transcriptional regulator
MKEKSDKLGETEYELLRLLSLGAGNRKIAQALCKSEFTVRNQLSHLYQKIKVANRAHAANWFAANAAPPDTTGKPRRTLANPPK